MDRWMEDTAIDLFEGVMRMKEWEGLIIAKTKVGGC